jgi:hypothetical protein
MADIAKRMFRLTKTGQPVMGSTAELYGASGEPIEVKCVGKLWGRGGNCNLIGIIVEYTDEEGGRDTFTWPLERRRSDD